MTTFQPPEFAHLKNPQFLAWVAAPILNECPLKWDVSKPARNRASFKTLSNSDLSTARPVGPARKGPGADPQLVLNADIKDKGHGKDLHLVKVMSAGG